MAAAAHTPGGFGGVSQKVGREFNQADKGSKLLSSAMRHRAAGGIGRSPEIHIPHIGTGSMGNQVAKPMSMGMASPFWERSAAHDMNTPAHRFGGGMGRGHAAGGGGQPQGMSMGMADPFWTRNEARQINDMSFHSGLIPGSGFGRTDRIPLSVGAESHVIPADAVSALGQGTNGGGASAWMAAIRSGPYGVKPPPAVHGHGAPHAPGGSHPGQGASESFPGGFAEGGEPENDGAGTHPKTAILAASGEVVIAPEDVEQLGERGLREGMGKAGESAMDCGHRLIDEAIGNVRKWQIDWLKRAPPPKKSMGGAIGLAA